MTKLQEAEIRGSFTRQDTKTFREVPIAVSEDTACLRIFFQYEPINPQGELAGEALARRKLTEYKELLGALGPAAQAYQGQETEEILKSVLPLRNLLHFSLYDPQGNFRGRWDTAQYYGKWVEIGPAERTARGFIPGLLPAGIWNLEIEVHAVVTDLCNYLLRYELTGFQPKWDWYQGELHLHTNHSDGNAPLGQVIAAAKQINLDFAVLSDHNTISAHQEIPQIDFPIIPGMELTTFYGHGVAMGVREFINWRHPQDHNFRDELDQIHAKGGLFSIAHPFVIGDPICTGCQWEYNQIDLHKVDLVEIWSGSWVEKWAANALAFQWWTELLNQGYKIKGVAARDVHRPEQFFLEDTANTHVYAASLREEHLLAGLSQGRVYLSSGPLLEFNITSRGQKYYLGDTVPREQEKYTAHIKIAELKEKALLRIVAGEDRPLLETPIIGTEELEQDLVRPGTNWIRAELWSQDRKVADQRVLLAVTNPIYFA